jgi:hypothetical protein
MKEDIKSGYIYRINQFKQIKRRRRRRLDLSATIYKRFSTIYYYYYFQKNPKEEIFQIINLDS